MLPKAVVQWRPWRRVPLTFAGPKTPAAVGNWTQLADLGEHRSHFLSSERSWNALAWVNTRKHRRCFLEGSSLAVRSVRSNLKCHFGGSGQASRGWCRSTAIPAARPDLPAGTAPVFPVFPVSRRSVRPLRALIALNDCNPTPPCLGLSLSSALAPLGVCLCSIPVSGYGPCCGPTSLLGLRPASPPELSR